MSGDGPSDGMIRPRIATNLAAQSPPNEHSMAIPSLKTPSSSATGPVSSNRAALSVVTTLFFMWGFVTVLNDVLVPHLKAIFDLNYARASLIQFSFFTAYFIFSIPAAKLIDRIGYKKTMVAGVVIMGLGALLFIPSASAASYPLFLAALMVLAGGITALQVAANPYVAVLGPPETASSRLNLAQAFNSLGTAIAPWLGGAIILSGTRESTDVVLRLHAFLNQLLGAPKLNLCIFQLDFEIGNGGLRGIAVGFGGIQGATRIGIIQRRQELPLRHTRTFIKHHTGHPAGNLRGDGGAPPRGDIPTGVQNARGTRGRLLRGGHFHFRLAVAKRGSSSGDQHQHDGPKDQPQPAPAGLCGIALGVVNAQRSQVGLQRFCGCRHQAASP